MNQPKEMAVNETFSKSLDLIARAVSVAVAAIFVTMAVVNFGYYRSMEGVRNLVNLGDIFFGTGTFVDFGIDGLFLPLLAPLIVGGLVYLFKRSSLARMAIQIAIFISFATASFWFPESPGVQSEGYVVHQALIVLMLAITFGVLPTLVATFLDNIFAYVIPTTIAWVIACEGIGFIWGITDFHDPRNRFVISLSDGRCIERSVLRGIGIGIVVVEDDNRRPDILPTDSIVMLQKDGFCPPDSRVE